jgi:prevent-host-death family protein
MVKHVTISEAKTHLSRLVEAAESGEEIVIARKGVLSARLVGLHPAGPVPVGFVHGVTVTDAILAPSDAEELAAW